jgi:hypothetical protein
LIELTKKPGPFCQILFFQCLGISRVSLPLACLEVAIGLSIVRLVDPVIQSVPLLKGFVVRKPGTGFSAVWCRTGLQIVQLIEVSLERIGPGSANHRLGIEP